MPTKQEQLEQIAQNIKICQKCRLCQTAKNAVPGEGNINSEVIFIGEAPGENEDLQGRPFVGRAGKLLEALLVKVGLSREQVWIGNIIKHRPPQNRDPLPDELEACQPYLTLQIKTINPKLIVTLGRFSMNYFYAEGKISRDHGQLIALKDRFVYPVYHPAAALRNPEMAKALVRDFVKIPEVLRDIKIGMVGKKPMTMASNDVASESFANPLGL